MAQVLTGKVFNAETAVTDEATAGVNVKNMTLAIALDMKNLNHTVDERVDLIFRIAAPLCGEYNSAHLLHG